MASRWRERADAVIDRAIREAEALQPSPLTSRKEARRFLNERYPFGARQHLPYRHWCKALNVALDRLFSQPAETAAIPLIRVHPRIGVSCQWCELSAAKPAGCLACCNVRLRFAAVTEETLSRWADWLDLDRHLERGGSRACHRLISPRVGLGRRVGRKSNARGQAVSSQKSRPGFWPGLTLLSAGEASRRRFVRSAGLSGSPRTTAWSVIWKPCNGKASFAMTIHPVRPDPVRRRP